MNFYEIKKEFDLYIDKLYELLIFKYSDIKDINILETRKNMLKIKYEHTMRMIESSIKTAKEMEFNLKLAEMFKVAILLHDIGRFEQVKYSDTFVDTEVYKNNLYIKDHGEEGYNFLINGGFKLFGIDDLYVPSIGVTVLHHAKGKIPYDLDFLITHDVMNLNPHYILTGTYNFNDLEKKIVSLLLQLVRDIDKLDILYQRAYGILKPYNNLMKVNNIGIKEVSNYGELVKNIYMKLIVKRV